MTLRAVAGGGAALSAGTNSQNSGTVQFSNSNGISFGMSPAGVITATVTPGAAAGIAAVQLSNTTYTSGTVNFINSNGISFGSTTGGGVTASYTVPVQSSLNFSNSNNVSFGIAGSTLTATVTVPAQTSLSFSNLNGVSFGTAGSTLTASVAAQSNQTEGRYALGNTTGQSSSSTFDARTMSISGAGGVSVGYSGNALVISGGAGGGAGQSIGVSTGGNTLGNTGTYSGQIVFAGGNNITLSVSSGAAGAQTITISGANAGGAQTGISGIVVSNTTYTSGTVSFSNANGISFGSSAGQAITASYTVPTQTNQSVGIYGSSQTTGQSSSSTVDARSLSIVGAGIVSIGMSGGSLVISGPDTTSFSPFSAGFSTGGNTAGTTSMVTGDVVFAGGANITLSGSTGAAGAMTVSIVGGAAGGIGLQAGTQTATSGTVLFSNSNGISFGMSNSSVVTASYTVPTQTNQTIGLYASSQTTAQSSSSTVDARSISFVGAGNISVGLSAGSYIISGAAGGQTNQTVGMYALGNTTQNSSTTFDARTLSFNGLGEITVGYSNGSIQLSAPVQSLGVSTGGNTLGNTGTQAGQVIFAGGNNITLSVSTAAGGAQTITISGANAGGAQTGISGIVVSNTTYTSGTVSFSNANGISFGSSAGQAITASYTVPTQTNQTVGLYGLGNTTQNSSTTLDARTISLNGLGAMTVGYSNGSVQLSAPATSSLSATGLVSLSTNGSTISIGAAPKQLSFFQPLPCFSTTITQIGNGSVQVYPAIDPVAFTATRGDIFASVSLSTIALSSEAIALSLYLGLYSLNGSTLSLASSGSQSYQWTNSSNNSAASISGLRRFSAPINVNYTGGFDLFVAVMSNTTFTNTNAQTLSNVVVPVGPGPQLQGLIGQVPSNSMQYVPGQGVFSASSAALPSSMALSAISGAGSGGNIPDNFSPVLFVNVTA